MNDNTKIQVADLVKNIMDLQAPLDSESKRLRTKKILDRFDKFDSNSWCVSVVGDSLIKLRLFTEQNFNFIETMGTIAVSRYIFELSVWLLLFESDSRYGLVYYSQLLDTQKRYYVDSHAQLVREMNFLKKIEEKEKEAQNKIVAEFIEKTPEKLVSEINRISGSIDKEAARHFSIYSDQAKINGYGFQAYLVENKVVPQVEQAIKDIETEISSFSSNIKDDVKLLIPKRWQWRQMAKKVGLQDEYDYIYSFSSKLLHATPSSITTNQKNLEYSELRIFLKYIWVKLNDLIELSKTYPK